VIDWRKQAVDVSEIYERQKSHREHLDYCRGCKDDEEIKRKFHAQVVSLCVVEARDAELASQLKDASILLVCSKANHHAACPICDAKARMSKVVLELENK